MRCWVLYLTGVPLVGSASVVPTRLCCYGARTRCLRHGQSGNARKSSAPIYPIGSTTPTTTYHTYTPTLYPQADDLHPRASSCQYLLPHRSWQDYTYRCLIFVQATVSTYGFNALHYTHTIFTLLFRQPALIELQLHNPTAYLPNHTSGDTR